MQVNGKVLSGSFLLFSLTRSVMCERSRDRRLVLGLALDSREAMTNFHYLFAFITETTEPADDD